MSNLILEPLSYAFMQRGLIAAVLVGIVCALVGTFIVLRGMTFFGDALAHAILPGVAVGYVVGSGAQGPTFWGALVTAILASLGIAMISSMGSYAVDLTHFLFGNVLGVSPSDLWLTAGLGGLVVLVVIAFYKEFLVLAFDPILAVTLRLPSRFLEYLLLVLIAVTIVVSLQTVGIALMVAMLVTPAATALLLTRRVHIMMILAAFIAAASGVIGLYFSFYVGIASGAAIVLTCTAAFLLVWGIQTVRKR
jgi:manganese/iron transport system permease protein